MTNANGRVSPPVDVIIALGGNIPHAQTPVGAVLAAAAARVMALGERAVLSGLWSSAAWPDTDRPRYLNAALRLTTLFSAHDLLQRLQALEARFGRKRVVEARWASRTLDLDMIDYGGQVLENTDAPRLQTPHPRAQARAFVLKPLADIAPNWRHPVSGLTTCQLLARLPVDDCADVQRTRWPQP